MVAYEGYYDASGSQAADDDPLAVAGIVANRNAWDVIDGEWGGVLRDFGVPYLHMKEFAQSKGPFAFWKGDETKRGKFLVALTDTLKGRIDYGIVIDVFHLRSRRWTDNTRSQPPITGPRRICSSRRCLSPTRWYGSLRRIQRQGVFTSLSMGMLDRAPHGAGETSDTRPARGSDRSTMPFVEPLGGRKLPDRLTQHDLRHRRVTVWLAEGKSPVLVKEAMAHSDIRTMGCTRCAKEHLRALVDPSPSTRAKETAS